MRRGRECPPQAAAHGCSVAWVPILPALIFSAILESWQVKELSARFLCLWQTTCLGSHNQSPAKPVKRRPCGAQVTDLFCLQQANQKERAAASREVKPAALLPGALSGAFLWPPCSHCTGHLRFPLLPRALNIGKAAS